MNISENDEPRWIRSALVVEGDSWSSSANLVWLDTSFIVDLLRGRKEEVAFLSDIEGSSEAITVAAPSVSEIVEAAEVACSEGEKETIRDFLSSLAVLPFDSDTAWAAGQLSASLIFSGEQIIQMDTLIGAIARYHDEPIVTHNKKHFGRIPGLRIQEY